MKPAPPTACDPREMRPEPACHHRPRCPGAAARERAAACVVACRPEQGWSLLCNGVVLFDDAGVLVLGSPVTSPGRASVTSPGRASVTGPGRAPVPSPGRAAALSRAA